MSEIVVRKLKQKNSLHNKIFETFLYLNGICINRGKLTQYILATFSNLLWVITASIPVACIASSFNQDLSAAFLIQQFISITLWWTLYLRRQNIFCLVSHTFHKSYLEIPAKIKIFSLSALFYFVSPPFSLDIIFLVSTDFTGEVVSNSNCLSFWLPLDTIFSRSVAFFLNITLSHASYGVFFTTFYLYFTCCCEISKNLRMDSEIVAGDAEMEWKMVRTYIKDISRVEESLSLPVFLLISKLMVDIFSTIFHLVNVGWKLHGSETYLVCSSAQVLWFTLIVGAGDALQSRASTIIGKCVEHVIDLKLDKPINCVSLKKIKSDATLTAWYIFKINKNLFLTAVTSMFTYGIILAQIKKDYSITYVTTNASKTHF